MLRTQGTVAIESFDRREERKLQESAKEGRILSRVRRAMMTIRKKMAIEFFFLTLLVAVFGTRAWCTTAAVNPEERTLKVGDSIIMGGQRIARVAIADPAVADVAVLSLGEILVNGKSVGRTTLYTWDISGRHEYRIIVRQPQLDLAKLCSQITEQINDERIQVKSVGDVIVLDGSVNKELDSTRAESIAKLVVDSANLPELMTEQPAKTQVSSSGNAEIYPVVDKAVEDKPCPAQTMVSTSSAGITKPKISNLIRIEKPFDEISTRTMQVAVAVKSALSGTTHKVRALPSGVVMIEGKVGTQAELDGINNLIKAWDGQKTQTTGNQNQVSDTFERISIVNAVALDASVAKQIMVRAQVVDINRTALKQFGVDWGRVFFTPSNIPGVAATANVDDQPWLIGQSGFGPFNLFGGGPIQRFDPVGARVRALEEQNKAKVLSEPNLLVLDGREASMLVGGEIPIPIVQSGQVGSAVSITVEYKEFGVRLRILPTITGNNTLQLRIIPEVSALDFAQGVSFSGFRIPAFRVRRAETIVDVKNGQSLIIGGLLQNDTAKLVRQIPVLGNLPVLGQLFRSTTYTDNQTELVIVVTPQIVQPTAPQTASCETTK